MHAAQFSFTKSEIARLSLPSRGQRIEYRDKDVPELRLRVSATNKTFYFFGRCPAISTNIRVRLGRHGVLGIDEARRRAIAIAGECASGGNPLEKRRQRRAELTFQELFDAYMAQHARPRKRTADEDAHKYQRHIAPSLKHLPLSRISLREVGALHARITRDAGPTTANRIHSLILGVFNWAIRQGLTATNPAKGVSRNRELSRERFVREDEMEHFLRAAKQESIPCIGDLFLLCLFTGQRIGNVLAMRWEEINLDAGIWTIPRTKNGRPLVVALIPQALMVLERRATTLDSQFVFPGMGRTGHLIEPKKGWRRVMARTECFRLIAALTQRKAMQAQDAAAYEQQAMARPIATREALRRAARVARLPFEALRTDDLRIHDLRRTLGSWLAMGGASQWVIGKVLGHQSPQSSAPYARVGTESQRHWVKTTVTAMLAASESQSD